jgi:hypothetical protein
MPSDARTHTIHHNSAVNPVRGIGCKVSHGKYDAAMNTYIMALSPRCNMSFNCLCKEQMYNFYKILRYKTSMEILGLVDVC